MKYTVMLGVFFMPALQNYAHDVCLYEKYTFLLLCFSIFLWVQWSQTRLLFRILLKYLL